MADQTDQPKPVSDPNGVVASGDMTKKHRKWHRKGKKPAKASAVTGEKIKTGDMRTGMLGLSPKRLVIAMVLLLVMAAGVAYFWVQKHPANKTVAGADYTFKFAGAGADTVAKASDSILKGTDPKTAIATIDTYINNHKSIKNQELAYLYSSKASLQLQYVSRKDALASIQKAIEINPSEPFYYVQAAEYSENQQAAKDYYTKALAAYDAGPPKDYSGPGRDYYTQRVNGN